MLAMGICTFARWDSLVKTAPILAHGPARTAGDRGVGRSPAERSQSAAPLTSSRWDETHRAQPMAVVARFRCPSGVPAPHQLMSPATARDAPLAREPDEPRPDRLEPRGLSVWSETTSHRLPVPNQNLSGSPDPSRAQRAAQSESGSNATGFGRSSIARIWSYRARISTDGSRPSSSHNLSRHCIYVSIAEER
jgi:hypothetical protein